MKNRGREKVMKSRPWDAKMEAKGRPRAPRGVQKATPWANKSFAGRDTFRCPAPGRPRPPQRHPQGTPKASQGAPRDPILDGFGTHFRSILETLPCPLIPSHPFKKNERKTQHEHHTPQTTHTFPSLRGGIPRQMRGEVNLPFNRV